MTATTTPSISESAASDARTSLMVGALSALVFANVVQIAAGLAAVDPDGMLNPTPA